MNHPTPPRLKSHTTPTGPHPAETAPATGGSGAPKDAAEGVVTALRPNPGPAGGPQPIGWLRITAPGRGATPTAHSWCACGRDLFAAGHRRVTALVESHTAHRATCPLRAAITEEKAA